MATGENGTKAVGAPIATLCQIVSAQVHRDVIDKTGLNGVFDYKLEFSVAPPGPGATIWRLTDSQRQQRRCVSWGWNSNPLQAMLSSS